MRPLLDWLPWRPARLQTRALEAASPRRWPIERQADSSPSSSTLGLETVRRRSRHAAMNNGWMARGCGSWEVALVGAGITCTAGHPDPATRADLQAAFARWSDHADADGRLDWPGLQAAIARELVVAGEAFVLLLARPEGLRLRVLPAELVDSALSMELAGGGWISAGVEFSSDGGRVAYHVIQQRAGLAIGQTVRVPAADLLHIVRPIQAGQVRGIPWAASVLLPLVELDALLDALLVGAKMAAMHCGVVTDLNATATAPPYDGTQIGSILESGLEPGTLKVLPAGMDVKFTTPQQAAQGIEHAKLQLRGVAAGLGLPEHLLTGDLSGANYSSLRAGLVDFRGRVEQIQWGILIPQLLRPVRERWLLLAVLSGEIDAPDFETRAPDYLAAEFYPPAMPWVDPLKDAEAEAAQIAAGLKSRRQAVAERGYSVEVLDAEIAADRAREAALGLSFSTPAPVPANAP